MTTPDHPAGPLPGVVNPVALSAVPGLRHLASVSLTLVLFVGLVAVANVAGRFFLARGLLRQQLKWVAISQVVALPLGALVLGDPRSGFVPLLAISQTLALQIVIVAAILRWRLYGVNVAVRRSLLALSLLVVAFGVYVAVVTLVAVVMGRSGAVPSAIGAVITALVFGPLSTEVRRWVDQLFYGRRRNPYAIVGVLARRLGEVATPEDALAGVAAALCDELRLPFVSIVATSGASLAEQGQAQPEGELHRFHLEHQGQAVGWLRVSPRRGETQLSVRDEKLLTELARHVGAAVHAASVLTDLRQARDRLVHAREDERRRLQRDLHDGLGPRLTAAGFMVDAATNQLTRRPEDARPHLESVRAELRDAVDDIRRIINQLGDPMLESLGLADAIRDQGARFVHDGFQVTVDAEAIPALPPAVEVAAYRIASEALANVARHSGASRCDIRILADSSLHLMICDDGQGLPADWAPGVGLASMTQRASELGGACQFGNAPDGGLVIRVDLPLHAWARAQHDRVGVDADTPVMGSTP